jgi:heterodisulfide reductase subunit B
MRFSYFPGCSLKGMGSAYEDSLLGVMRILGVELNELDDWNCCGATAYMAVDEERSFCLASRNLVLAERSDDQLLAPCAACYLVLMKTQRMLRDYPAVGARVKAALKEGGYDYRGTARIRHPLDVLFHDVGLERILQAVKTPLKGVKVACYYGCQVVRPYATFDHQDYPETMDKLMKALGAEPVHFPLKTKCCGGSLTGTLPEVGANLCQILIREARRQGADMLTTLCPLCHFNIDGYQRKATGLARLPITFFTQLMGVAFGIPAAHLGLERLIVPALPVLRERQVAVV